MSIPGSVRELGYKCFYEHKNLRSVIFEKTLNLVLVIRNRDNITIDAPMLWLGIGMLTRFRHSTLFTLLFTLA